MEENAHIGLLLQWHIHNHSRPRRCHQPIFHLLFPDPSLNRHYHLNLKYRACPPRPWPPMIWLLIRNWVTGDWWIRELSKILISDLQYHRQSFNLNPTWSNTNFRVNWKEKKYTGLFHQQTAPSNWSIWPALKHQRVYMTKLFVKMVQKLLMWNWRTCSPRNRPHHSYTHYPLFSPRLLLQQQCS
jgi:hypothetical protein